MRGEDQGRGRAPVVLNTHRSLTWTSTEHTAFQRVEADVAQFEAAMQGGK